MTTTEETTATDDAPTVDERDPATLIPAAVDEILQFAGTWLAWDGAPIVGDGNAWTPLKALRRIADHLLDHLAEIEATLAGQPTVPDTWHGRTVTLESDWARFTEGDLNEASNRLPPQGYQAPQTALAAPALLAVIRAGRGSGTMMDRCVHRDVHAGPSSLWSRRPGAPMTPPGRCGGYV
jgi:hypothetical protein